MPSNCYRLRFSAGTVLVCLDLLQCALRLYGSCHVVLHVYAAAADQLWPPLRILGLWNRARGLPGHVGNARVLGNLWNKSALFRRLRCSMCSRHSGTINKKTRLSGADAVKHTASPPLCVWRQDHALESVTQTHGSSAQSPRSLWANIGAPAHGLEPVFERKYGCRYACNSHEVRVRPRAL